MKKNNYYYILDRINIGINANLVYTASYLANYIESKSWQTLQGNIEINASDGHIFGSYWCDKYGTMCGMFSIIATTPTAYSYVVSNGTCILSLLSNN